MIVGKIDRYMFGEIDREKIIIHTIDLGFDRRMVIYRKILITQPNHLIESIKIIRSSR